MDCRGFNNIKICLKKLIVVKSIDLGSYFIGINVK